MTIGFSKLQGLGNDFILIDNRETNFDDKKLSKMAKRLCTRKLSIGADGLMAINTTDKTADFAMKFFNSDGSIGEMCGNGARCIARYAYVNKIAPKNLSFITTAGTVHAEIIDDRLVCVQLNNPSILDLKKCIVVKDKDFYCSYVELGNPGVPHAIVHQKSLLTTNERDLIDIAKEIRFNKAFPKGANVNFYDIVDNKTAIIKTYERGVENFTLACGTGSASTAIALILKGILKDNCVNIITDGGTLKVKLDRDDLDIKKVFLTGDTLQVCNGIITDPHMIF